MSNDKEIGVSLTAKDEGLTAGIKKAESEIKSLSQRFSELRSNASKSVSMDAGIDSLVATNRTQVMLLAKINAALEQTKGKQEEINQATEEQIGLTEQWSELLSGLNPDINLRGEGPGSFGALGLGLRGGGLMIASGAMAGMFGSAVSKAIEFEDVMADVAKVTGFSASEVDDFGKRLTALTRIIPLPTTELSKLATAGGRMYKDADDLATFVELSAKMATAFDITTEEAGKLIGNVANVFGLGIHEIELFGDTINTLGNSAVTNERDIVAVMNRIGGSAKNDFGLANHETAALATTMLELGKTEQTAATALGSLLNRMLTAKSAGAKFQEALAQIGLTADEMGKKIQEGPMEAIFDLLERINKLEGIDRANVLTELFGREFQDDISLLAGAYEKLQQNLEKVNDQSKIAGSMQAEFAERLKTTKSQLLLLGNAWDEVLGNLGGALLEAVKPAVSALQWLLHLMADAQQGVGKLGAAFSSLSFWLDEMWNSYLSTLGAIPFIGEDLGGISIDERLKRTQNNLITLKKILADADASAERSAARRKESEKELTEGTKKEAKKQSDAVKSEGEQRVEITKEEVEEKTKLQKKHTEEVNRLQEAMTGRQRNIAAEIRSIWRSGLSSAEQWQDERREGRELEAQMKKLSLEAERFWRAGDQEKARSLWKEAEQLADSAASAYKRLNRAVAEDDVYVELTAEQGKRQAILNLKRLEQERSNITRRHIQLEQEAANKLAEQLETKKQSLNVQQGLTEQIKASSTAMDQQAQSAEKAAAAQQDYQWRRPYGSQSWKLTPVVMVDGQAIEQPLKEGIKQAEQAAKDSKLGENLKENVVSGAEQAAVQVKQKLNEGIADANSGKAFWQDTDGVYRNFKKVAEAQQEVATQTRAASAAMDQQAQSAEKVANIRQSATHGPVMMRDFWQDAKGEWRNYEVIAAESIKNSTRSFTEGWNGALDMFSKNAQTRTAEINELVQLGADGVWRDYEQIALAQQKAADQVKVVMRDFWQDTKGTWRNYEVLADESAKNSTEDFTKDWDGAFTLFSKNAKTRIDELSKELDEMSRDRTMTLTVRTVQAKSAGGLIGGYMYGGAIAMPGLSKQFSDHLQHLALGGGVRNMLGGGHLPGFGGGDRRLILGEDGEIMLNKYVNQAAGIDTGLAYNAGRFEVVVRNLFQRFPHLMDEMGGSVRERLLKNMSYKIGGALGRYEAKAAANRSSTVGASTAPEVVQLNLNINGKNTYPTTAQKDVARAVQQEIRRLQRLSS